MKLHRSLILVLVVVLLAGGAFAAVANPNGVFRGYPIVRVRVNGQEVFADVPAIMFNGRTMVPVRLVSEALGAEVGWDPDKLMVSLTPPVQDSGSPVAEEPVTEPSEPAAQQPVPPFTSIESLEDYLNNEYPIIDTPVGPLKLRYMVSPNDSHFLPYDLKLYMDHEGSPSFFLDTFGSFRKISISDADKQETQEVLQEHARQVYNVMWGSFEGKKIEGSYYRSWYQYPSLRVGFESRHLLSWRNYDWDILGPGTNYDNAEVSSFRFTPDDDDYPYFR